MLGRQYRVQDYGWEDWSSAGDGEHRQDPPKRCPAPVNLFKEQPRQDGVIDEGEQGVPVGVEGQSVD